MEMLVLDTIGKLWRHGHGMFGWCSRCAPASRYRGDVKAGRAPRMAMFDIDLRTLVRQRGENSPIVGREPIPCPRCGSLKTETRITAPAKPMRRGGGLL